MLFVKRTNRKLPHSSNAFVTSTCLLEFCAFVLTHRKVQATLPLLSDYACTMESCMLLGAYLQNHLKETL